LLGSLLANCFGSISIDYPDTEVGKQVAKFAKKFQVPLRQAGRKKKIFENTEKLQKPMLHVFLQGFDACFIGVSYPEQRSVFHNGIHRLKFPSAAPSRSTLKLEEAFKDLLGDDDREQFLREGGRAVDLGACPGGWTYQLVNKGMYVEAVDNGEMAPSLMQTGLVSYKPADGFKYRPEFGSVDMVVCDMIEQPDRVAQLLSEWLTKEYAKSAVFNLKLPMKKRFETVNKLLSLISDHLNTHSKTQFKMRCKHLYHNRDEVTVSLMPH
jgi:23S rRNA (cytidine2498-2'-O)-methyltransferase